MITDINMSPAIKQEFEDIQWKSWEVAGKLNPKSQQHGFNINSSYQCEIYPESDYSPLEDWAPGDLVWDNFIQLFPEYISFCEKYNFYKGCTMIARPIYCAHRHGFGEHTVTYPLHACDDVKVICLTPLEIERLNDQDIHWLKNNEEYNIDYEYRCITGQPFILKADHFHKTSDIPEFVDGKTIFTVWHELSTFNKDDVKRLVDKLSK